MRNKFLEVRLSDGKGRGLFSIKNIPKGTIVETSVLLESTHRNSFGNHEILANYCFQHPERPLSNETVLSLGFGSLFNHSKKPNVKWKYKKEKSLGNQYVLIFYTARTIERNEELLVNYGYDPSK